METNAHPELAKRVTAVETRVTVIEKTMVTADVFQRELAAFRDEVRLAIGGLQEQIGRLRDEIRVGFGELRTQMQAQDGALRAEVGGLRDEMHVGFGELRTEMQAQQGALRTEMRAMDGALRVEITKTPFDTFKWLLAAAGLAAGIATAIYNIWFR